MKKDRTQKLYDKVLKNFLKYDGQSWYGGGDLVVQEDGTIAEVKVDPLVSEFLHYKKQKELHSKALKCIFFGWVLDFNEKENYGGHCCDDDDDCWGCGAIARWGSSTGDWANVAVFDHHRTSSLDYGSGEDWTACYVSLCNRWQVEFVDDGYP